MKYMSGFSAEKYNMSSSELEPRAIGKAKKDAKVLMNDDSIKKAYLGE